MEMAGGSYNVFDSNVIDGNNVANSAGIFLDGADGAAAMYNTLTSNNVSKVKTACIQVYHTANNNSIMGGILTQTTASQKCINIIGAQGTLITGVRMNGTNTAGTFGVFMDNSGFGGNNNYITSGTIINGCTFADFGSAAMGIYASTGGTITGIRILNNTLNSGTMLSTTLTGATVSAPYYFGNSPEIIGSKVMLAIGANSGAGSAILAAGTVTVPNTAITANSIIFLSVSAVGGTQGILSYTKIAGTNFTIKSSAAADTSTISWIIID